jgi:hypothetical protein
VIGDWWGGLAHFFLVLVVVLVLDCVAAAHHDQLMCRKDVPGWDLFARTRDRYGAQRTYSSREA